MAYTGTSKLDAASSKLVRQAARTHAARNRRGIDYRMRSSSIQRPLRANGAIHAPFESAKRDGMSLHGTCISSRHTLDNFRNSPPRDPISVGLPGNLNRHEIEDESPSKDTNDLVQQISQAFQIIELFGASRVDPFVKWPIALNHKSMTLIDYRAYCPINSPFPCL